MGPRLGGNRQGNVRRRDRTASPDLETAFALDYFAPVVKSRRTVAVRLRAAVGE